MKIYGKYVCVKVFSLLQVVRASMNLACIRHSECKTERNRNCVIVAEEWKKKREGVFWSGARVDVGTIAPVGSSEIRWNFQKKLTLYSHTS